MKRFYSKCSHSLHPAPFCHHTRMRVLSLKSTQHNMPTDTRMKAHTHTYREETPMQGSKSRLQDRRSEETQIKTLQNHHCLYSREKQQAKWEANNAEPLIMLLLSDNKLWSQFQVNRGPSTLRGSSRGWRGRCCPYLSTELQRNTRSPLNFFLLAFTKFFNNSLPCTPSHPHCEKLLNEGKEKLQDKLHSRRFSNIDVYCSSTSRKLGLQITIVFQD